MSGEWMLVILGRQQAQRQGHQIKAKSKINTKGTSGTCQKQYA